MDLVPYREQENGLWNSANNTKQVIVQHTTESEGGCSGVVGYLEATQNGSYQTMCDFDGEEVRMVPDNRQAWAAMATGNRIGLHTCVMGRASYPRDRWLSEAKLLERTAMRYAEWSRLYGIPLVKITPADVRAGKRGVCGHVDITNAFRESDHTDPGGNFPYDAVIARANQINNPKELDMTADEMKALIFECLEEFVGPIGSDVKDIREQITGARDLIRDPDGTIDLKKSYPGYPDILGVKADGSGRTLTDAVGVLVAEGGK